MNWLNDRVHSLHLLAAQPQLLALIVVGDVAAYFSGLLFWYGYVMANPATPAWAWLFIPDCPLFGLVGGLGLLMATARNYWNRETQQRGQHTLLVAATVSTMLWLSTYLPGSSQGWIEQKAMFGVWSWMLLLGGLCFRQPPNWLLGVFAFGQIKYGIWTVTAWALFWRNSAKAFGTPLFTFGNVSMTIIHIGLIAQGLLLLTYFKPAPMSLEGATKNEKYSAYRLQPTFCVFAPSREFIFRLDWLTALVSFIWFASSDYVDYALGFHPAIPEQFIPVSVMQWSTVAVTLLLSSLYVLQVYLLSPRFMFGCATTQKAGCP